MVKAIVNAVIFKNAFFKALSVVDKKSIRPYLNLVFLQFKKEGVVDILASDGETSIRYQEKCQVLEEGNFCVGVKYFPEILKELPDQDVFFRLVTDTSEMLALNLFSEEDLPPVTIDNTAPIKKDQTLSSFSFLATAPEKDISSAGLEIQCGKIQFTIPVAKGTDYPLHLFRRTGNSSNSLLGADLVTLLSKTSHTIPSDEMKHHSFGLCLKKKSSKELIALATDGHRLSLFETSGNFQEINEALEEGIVLSKKALSEMKKIGEEAKNQEIFIDADEACFYLNFQNKYFLTLRPSAQEFPNYESVIPKNTSYRVVANRINFINALKRVKIISHTKSFAVRLLLSPNLLSIETTSNIGLGVARDQLTVEFDGPELDIAMNAKYLLESLGAIGEDIVLLEFNNQYGPMLIRDPYKNTYFDLIMPLKL